MWVHTWVCVCVHACMQTCMYSCIHTCVYTCVCCCIELSSWVDTRIWRQCHCIEKVRECSWNPCKTQEQVAAKSDLTKISFQYCFLDTTMCLTMCTTPSRTRLKWLIITNKVCICYQQISSKTVPTHFKVILYPKEACGCPLRQI